MIAARTATGELLCMARELFKRVAHITQAVFGAG